MTALLRDTLRDYRTCWRQLVLTDIACKVIAFVLLTPLVALLFRLVMAASGNALLADQDVLFFFLGPVGWLCLITVGALWLGIVALELAALMTILAASSQQQPIRLFAALRIASSSAWPVIQVTGRMIARTLLAVAPFLILTGVAYFALLTDYDINYYLQETPPVFLAAIGLGALIGGVLLVVLLRMFTGWSYTLPLVLFEQVSPSRALQISRERARGHRPLLLYWLIGWSSATCIVSMLTTSLVVLLARLVVPRAAGSLTLLTIAIGGALLVWAIAGLAVNLLSTTSFATIYVTLYRHFGSDGVIQRAPLEELEQGEGSADWRLSIRRLISLGVAGVLIATGIGVIAVRSIRLDDNVSIIAHRGSSQAAPENTMAAIKQAIADGADWIEIDVQETADGEVVVFHDSDFMKLASVDLKIWDANANDLKEIDVGSWHGEEFGEERVPTLAAVLDECQGKAGVNIELKYYGHDQQLEQRVVEIVEAHEMAANVVVMSLKIDAVKKMKALRPDWKVGLLMSVSAGDLQSIEADFLAVNASFASRMLLRAAHAIDKEVYVWTVNDAASMSKMIGRGVDGLITDKPALARSVLRQRTELSTGERLLVELADSFGVATEIGEQ